MNFGNNQSIIIAYSISNIVGLLILWASIKKPKIARLAFVLLFGGACWLNYTSAHEHPEVYMSYATFAISFYKSFINGWFKDHIGVMVTIISIGQGAIAIGMLLKGAWVTLACIGVILFLLGIAPLGIGSAFPFSLIVALAAWFVIKKDDSNYLWKFSKK